MLTAWPISYQDATCGSVAGSKRPLIPSCRQASFREQEPSQCAKVVEDSPAGSDVQIQFGQIKGNQEKRLFATVGAFALGNRNFSVNITPGFIEGFGQERNILVGPLDTVKWRFGLVAHKHAFPTSLRPRGWPCLKLSVLHSRTKATKLCHGFWGVFIRTELVAKFAELPNIHRKVHDATIL